jgi:hypothetical protein
VNNDDLSRPRSVCLYAKTIAGATNGIRQEGRGTYPAGFALNGMRLFVPVLSLDLAGNADDRQRAIRKNVFGKL